MAEKENFNMDRIAAGQLEQNYHKLHDSREKLLLGNETFKRELEYLEAQLKRAEQEAAT